MQALPHRRPPSDRAAAEQRHAVSGRQPIGVELRAECRCLIEHGATTPRRAARSAARSHAGSERCPAIDAHVGGEQRIAARVSPDRLGLIGGRAKELAELGSVQPPQREPANRGEPLQVRHSAARSGSRSGVESRAVAATSRGARPAGERDGGARPASWDVDQCRSSTTSSVGPAAAPSMNHWRNASSTSERSEASASADGAAARTHPERPAAGSGGRRVNVPDRIAGRRPRLGGPGPPASSAIASRKGPDGSSTSSWHAPRSTRAPRMGPRSRTRRRAGSCPSLPRHDDDEQRVPGHTRAPTAAAVPPARRRDRRTSLSSASRREGRRQ